MRPSFYFFLLSILITACNSESPKSNTVDIKTIYQKHKASFRDGKLLYLESEFSTNTHWDRLETEKDGDHIELTAPSQILFNGKPMNKDNSVFTGAMYTLKEEGLPTELTWEWTDNNGKKYTNSVKMNPINVTENNAKYIDRDMVVIWEGLPVQEHEQVSVSINGNVNGKEKSSVSSTSKVGESSITLTHELLKQYRGEAVTISITRKAKIPIQEGTDVGGHIILYYEGGWFTTSIIDRL